jgi:hypothetical protein
LVQILEIDYNLPNDDLDRASSEGVDGSAPIGLLYLNSSHSVEHFAIRSSKVPLQTNYAVAVLKGNSLHLTPVHKMYQMRPDFKAIDERDKATEKRKEEAKLQRLKAEGKAPPDTPALKAAQVQTVQESERSKWLREHSWSYLKGLEDEEPFENLGFIGREENIDGDYFEGLVYQDEASPNNVPWNLDKKTYLAAINPQAIVEEDIEIRTEYERVFFK